MTRAVQYFAAIPYAGVEPTQGVSQMRCHGPCAADNDRLTVDDHVEVREITVLHHKDIDPYA